MTKLARVLHISDLHFLAELRRDPRKFHELPFGHSFGAIDALNGAVRTLEHFKGKFDLVLVTGDVTDDGLEGSFRTALSFIQDAKVHIGRPGKYLMNGHIQATQARRLFVPGNHDRYRGLRRWQSTGNALFETVLGTPQNYGYVRGFRPPNLRNDPHEPALLFFVFDSTPSFWARMRFPRSMARGWMDPAACEMIYELANEVIRRGQVDGIDGEDLSVDFNLCSRIAVLHHHPLDEASTTLMENSDVFIKWCFKAGMDVVLFGHDHKEFETSKYTTQPLSVPSRTPMHWLQFICCPSASECSAENGFFTYDFDDRGFTHQLYQLQSGSFVGRNPVRVEYSR